jgi:vacuolar-type H+-ATPase subunit H
VEKLERVLAAEEEARHLVADAKERAARVRTDGVRPRRRPS